MKINEKNVKELLTEIGRDLNLAYESRLPEWKNLRIQNAKGKIQALLTIVEFE